MRVTNRPDLEEQVISILKAISGRKVITPEQLIGRDVGIYGLDSIEAVEQLEREFDLDLRPLIEAHLVTRRRTWLDRLTGGGHPYADMAVTEVVDYIDHETRQKAT